MSATSHALHPQLLSTLTFLINTVCFGICSNSHGQKRTPLGKTQQTLVILSIWTNDQCCCVYKRRDNTQRVGVCVCECVEMGSITLKEVIHLYKGARFTRLLQSQQLIHLTLNTLSLTADTHTHQMSDSEQLWTLGNAHLWMMLRLGWCYTNRWLPRMHTQ